MRRQAAYGLVATAMLSLSVGPALAQTRNCAPRDFVVQRLAERYGESRQAMGLSANNAVMEVFASDESGSWTITVTYPTGLTCMIASGQAFEELDEILPSRYGDA